MKRIYKQTLFIAYTAIFAALSIVTKIFDIDIGLSNRLTFFYTVVMLAGIYMGPLCGFTAGITGDLVGFLVKPTGPFNPFIFIASGVWGLIPGLVFWYLKTNSKTINLLISYVAGFILATCGLTTYGLFIMYGGGNTFFPYLFSRIWVQMLVIATNYAITLSLMDIKELKKFFAFRKEPGQTSAAGKVKRRTVFALSATAGIALSLALVFLVGGSISKSWTDYYSDNGNYQTAKFVVTPANTTDSVPVSRPNGEKLFRLQQKNENNENVGNPITLMMSEKNAAVALGNGLTLKAGDAVTVMYTNQHSNYRIQKIIVSLEKDGVNYLAFETGSANLISEHKDMRAAHLTWVIISLITGTLCAAAAVVISLKKPKEKNVGSAEAMLLKSNA